MLFKVSFKDTPKRAAKTVVVSGRKVSVLLTGSVKLPEFWKHVPDEIIEWMESNSGGHLSGQEEIATNTFHLKAFGHAVCHEEDKFDYDFGVRLAEARAKLRIYKFFYGLTCRLYDYYDNLLFGFPGTVAIGEGSCIASDLRKYESLCLREEDHIAQLLKKNKQ